MTQNPQSIELLVGLKNDIITYLSCNHGKFLPCTNCRILAFKTMKRYNEFYKPEYHQIMIEKKDFRLTCLDNPIEP